MAGSSARSGPRPKAKTANTPAKAEKAAAKSKEFRATLGSTGEATVEVVA